MQRSTTAVARASLAVLLALSLAFCGLLASSAVAASGKSESEAEFKQQLAAKQVQSVVINKHERSLRVTLKDGTQITTRYPKKQSEQTKQRLEARHVTVTVLTPAEAAKEAGTKKKSHHKLRYIVGGVVVLVIVIAAGVLIYTRRRGRD